MPLVSRRAFVTASSVAVAVPGVAGRAIAGPVAPADDPADDANPAGLPAGYPRHAPDVVRSVVGKSHVDYDAVHDLVTARPELAKAAWDWGFGDWESALGAASHMGRRDIAELLIAHGARPNLFTYAMMDQVDAVRAICTANPGIQRQPGPHGITLLAHARHGKADAVVEYLATLGGADEVLAGLPIDETEAAVYAGRYAPAGAAGTHFVVAFHERRQGLTLRRDEEPFRFLVREETHVFSPGGAASVRIRFEVGGDAATALTIRDGPLAIRAARA